MRYRTTLVPLLAVLLLAAACGGGGGDGGSEAAGGDLVGLFRITGGECAAGSDPTGSFFIMVEPGGTLEEGPFVENTDSPCEDQTFSPLLPGSDGGLMTGSYQPEVSPPFDDAGNGKTAVLTRPTTFFGVDFANSTNEKDPQTGDSTTVPTVTADGGTLAGDLSAFAASWNGQHFNQGAPKPGGEMPGLTSGPTGTYDEATGAFTLEWSSQIVGGPFNNFTGIWRLEGTFEPSG